LKTASRYITIVLTALTCLYSLTAMAEQSIPVETAKQSCEVHIWQRGLYATESHSSAVGGIVGAVIKDGYEKKYPADTVEGLMEDVLNIEALPVTLKDIQWQNFTKSSENKVVYEKEILSDSDFKVLKSSKKRQTTSVNACYLELYIGRQTFSGGTLKSHLFSDMYARTFIGPSFAAKGAILWDQTNKVSVKDEQSKADARETFKSSFAVILTKFLNKKLPRPK
jgi:hypothetical protein